MTSFFDVRPLPASDFDKRVQLVPDPVDLDMANWIPLKREELASHLSYMFNTLGEPICLPVTMETLDNVSAVGEDTNLCLRTIFWAEMTWHEAPDASEPDKHDRVNCDLKPYIILLYYSGSEKTVVMINQKMELAHS